MFRISRKSSSDEGHTLSLCVVAVRLTSPAVCVSDAFVNSQEWTLSRTVPELKVVSPPPSAELRPH